MVLLRLSQHVGTSMNFLKYRHVHSGKFGIQRRKHNFKAIIFSK